MSAPRKIFDQREFALALQDAFRDGVEWREVQTVRINANDADLEAQRRYPVSGSADDLTVTTRTT